METYRKTIVVKEEDLDELNHVNNVRYVQWIQDISKEHWLEAAPEEMRNGVIWVVMTHHISYRHAAKLGEVIDVRTHIDRSRGATSVRVVEMHNKSTNQLLLRSSTEWCLLSAKTAKPIRISEEIKEVFL